MLARSLLARPFAILLLGWRDHRQRDFLLFRFHLDHPHVYHVADAHHVVRALDVAVRQLADVDEAAFLHADVNESPERHDVEHGAFEFHAGRHVFDFEDAVLEDRRRQFVARVAAGAGQRCEHIVQQHRLNVQLICQGFEVRFVELRPQGFYPGFIGQLFRAETEIGQDETGQSITLGVNPGAVERLIAAFDFEEARGLDEAGFADLRHLL